MLVYVFNDFLVKRMSLKITYLTVIYGVWHFLALILPTRSELFYFN